MSKRLQVVMEEAEMRAVRRAAKLSRVTVSAWAREALRKALRVQPTGERSRKLAVLDRALVHEFPAPDIEEMNAEIGRGYDSGWQP